MGREACQPTDYARLVYRAWDALDQVGDVFYIEPGLIAGYCPVCGVGTLWIRLLWQTDPPQMRLDGCTDGCPPELIAKVI